MKQFSLQSTNKSMLIDENTFDPILKITAEIDFKVELVQDVMTIPGYLDELKMAIGTAIIDNSKLMDIHYRKVESF